MNVLDRYKSSTWPICLFLFSNIQSSALLLIYVVYCSDNIVFKTKEFTQA